MVSVDLNQQNAHTRDKAVSFEAKTHTYTINGSTKGVTSVTTLLDDFFPKFDPDAIIEKYYNRWQQNPLKKPECYGKSKEEIKEMWKSEGEKAAREGTRLHAAIEAYYKGGDIDYDKTTKEWKYFLSFQEEYKLQVYRTEMILWSSDHKLAGMVDLLVRHEDGTISIYDWKRTKNSVRKNDYSWGRVGFDPLTRLPDNKYYRYAMQLNLYRELLERFYDFTVRAMYVVRLHPDADNFEVVEVERLEGEAQDLFEQRLTDATVDTDLVGGLQALELHE